MIGRQCRVVNPPLDVDVLLCFYSGPRCKGPTPHLRRTAPHIGKAGTGTGCSPGFMNGPMSVCREVSKSERVGSPPLASGA